MSTGDDQAAAERAKLHEAMAITAAESTVTSARMADLVEAQRAARARHSADNGLLTKAMKDGSAEKIAAARAREAAAYAEADRIGLAAIEEMLALNAAGLDNLGQVLDQMGRAWEADAAARRELEAGQRGRRPARPVPRLRVHRAARVDGLRTGAGRRDRLGPARPRDVPVLSREPSRRRR